MEIRKENQLDLIPVTKPSLSTNSDMPVIETRPDAQNEGAPPKKPEPEVKAAPAKEDISDASKTLSESATEHTDEHSGEPAEAKKPPRGVQKKLDELTKREADALRLFDAERQEKLRLLTLLEEKGKSVVKAEVVESKDEAEPVKPAKADFSDPDAYEAAMDTYIDSRATWKAKAEVRLFIQEQEKKADQKAVEEGQRAAQEAFSVRVEKAKAKYTDYQEVAESPEVNVSIPMAQAILHSEHGPDIAYFLGDDARKGGKEAARIAQLSPPLQLVELGLILAKSSTPLTVAPAEVKPSLTQAPKPIKPLGAGSEATKSIEDESMDEYAARRKKELATERRPGMRH